MELVHGGDVTTDPPPIREVCTAPYKVEPQLVAVTPQTDFPEDSLQNSRSIQLELPPWVKRKAREE